MSKDRGKRYTDSEKEELLQLFEQSGCSVSRFSKEMGVSYGTLRRWLGREKPRFDLVEVAAPFPASSGAMRVRLPNGIECQIPQGFVRGEAAALIRELAAC